MSQQLAHKPDAWLKVALERQRELTWHCPVTPDWKTIRESVFPPVKETP